jgi:hypothetical protein
MFKVFVSYSTLDLKNVERLQQSLAGTGVEVFVAEDSVRPSESLPDRLSQAIAACDMFVVLWSANAKASGWVSQEIGKAHSLGKPILPLVLEDELPVPGFIGQIKYIPMYRDVESGMAIAQATVLQQYQAKQAARKQKADEDARNLLVLGGLVLWLFS